MLVDASHPPLEQAEEAFNRVGMNVATHSLVDARGRSAGTGSRPGLGPHRPPRRSARTLPRGEMRPNGSEIRRPARARIAMGPIGLFDPPGPWGPVTGDWHRPGPADSCHRDQRTPCFRAGWATRPIAAPALSRAAAMPAAC